MSLTHALDQSEEHMGEYNQASDASNNAHHGGNGKGAEDLISCDALTNVVRL